MKTYYKAVRSDGVTATRGSVKKFSHAVVHRAGSDSAGSNWFGRLDLAQRFARSGQEICEAVEITAKEMKDIKEAANPSNIIVCYTSIDGFKETRKFRKRRAAREWAGDLVGVRPTLGSNYAVSHDGIGKITVQGMTLQELFPHVR